MHLKQGTLKHNFNYHFQDMKSLNKSENKLSLFWFGFPAQHSTSLNQPWFWTSAQNLKNTAHVSTVCGVFRGTLYTVLCISLKWENTAFKGIFGMLTQKPHACLFRGTAHWVQLDLLSGYGVATLTNGAIMQTAKQSQN